MSIWIQSQPNAITLWFQKMEQLGKCGWFVKRLVVVLMKLLAAQKSKLKAKKKIFVSKRLLVWTSMVMVAVNTFLV
ncbi:hypothetical protein D3C72_1883130 [compost metagenome]